MNTYREIAAASACVAQPPTPGPEVQKLAYFLGMWKAEGDLIGGPAAGKFSGEGPCEWFTGGFHVICRREGISPEGKHTHLQVFAYDAEAKAYTFYDITSRGTTLFAKGSLTGDTWTWLWEEKGWGKPATFRITQVQLSPTAYTIKVDYSLAGGPWTVIEEGRATRVKSRAARLTVGGGLAQGSHGCDPRPRHTQPEQPIALDQPQIACKFTTN